MSIFVTDVFDRLRDDEAFFISSVYGQYVQYAQDHGVICEVSKRRLIDARLCWLEDIKRAKDFELQTSQNVEAYKQCGHLTYWLRRMCIYNKLSVYEEVDTENERIGQEFFIKYASSYAAFRLGYDICCYSISNAEGSNLYFSDFCMSDDYRFVVSHFLATKNVSPHSLFLIFKSLFLNPFSGKEHDSLV